MSDDPNSSPVAHPPLPRIKKRRWVPSLIWLVPVTAALIGASLLINEWRTAGPQVTISFQTAEGLEVGKTLVKYRNVTIGHVTAISLSADHARVLVTADLSKSAEELAMSDTEFWVVRPRIGIGWVSGLDTLISGAFIAAEGGESKVRRRHFVGLENPPPLTHGLLGKSFVLHAGELGSVTLGAPVYFRRFEVGRVVDRQLDADGRGVQVVVFIDAPNDRFVNRSTRFWNASGIELSLGADGLKMKTQSLASVLAGGVAFETAPTIRDPLPASSGAQFTLFQDKATAMAPLDGEPHYVRMRFVQSLRGLSIGAPVEFVGVNIGSVFSIDLDYDASEQSFPVIVTALVYPRRMGKAYEVLAQRGATESEQQMAQLVGALVAHGLRAQPRPGSLLTGQLYLALDFIPGARPVRFNAYARPLEIPTVPGSISELQSRLASIVTKIDQMPLGEIAAALDDDLNSLHGTLERFRTQTLPAGTATLEGIQQALGTVDHALSDDASWRENLDQTLVEARGTLRSVRSLSDYLDRHPEALVRGRHDTQPPLEQPSAVAGTAQ